MQSERRLAVVLSIVLGLITLAIYSPAVVIPFDFLDYDDPTYVTGDPVVRTGLSVANLRWAATSWVCGNWHPLTVISHMLDVELYGLAPRGHHLTSVLLHAANGVLLFWLMRSMTSLLWPSALVAALFAWHPLRVESVAWISERKDVLSTFFFLLALLAYARFARRGGWRAYAAMTICFALGLMSKPMLVTFPFVLLLLDVWPLRRIAGPGEQGGAVAPASVWRLVAEKLPLVPLSVAVSLTTLSTQAIGIKELPLAARMAGAAHAYCAYLGKAFYPYPLYVPYLGADADLSLAATLAYGAGLIVVTLLALLAFRRRAYITTGWFWYLGTLVPVIGIVQVGEQSMADRYTYIPLIGIYWIVAWASLELAGRGPAWRRAVLAVVPAALTILVALSLFQVSIWRDTKSLFTHTVRYSPRNHVANSSLANDAYARGDYEEALEKASRALEVYPTALGPLAIRAQALASSGQTREAIVAYQRVLNMNPNNAYLLNELARILATCEDPRFRNGQAAMEIATRASAIYGGQNPHILDTIAAAHAELGEWQQAVETAHRARTLARRNAGGIAKPWVNGLDARLELYRQRIPYRVRAGVWND